MTILSDKFYTINQAAVYFGISSATVRNWLKCGHIKLSDRKISGKDILKLKKDIELGKVNKLRKRANKSGTSRVFSPDEYHTSGINYSDIAHYIKTNNLNLSNSIKYLLYNYMISNDLFSFNKNAMEEFLSWNIDIRDERYAFLVEYDIEYGTDPVGYIYQSLLEEGKKSVQGSYYTPSSVVNSITKDIGCGDCKILDPCCGTGQFLLSFAEAVKDPNNIKGFDIDPTAVAIAKVNLMIKFKHVEFKPAVYCVNSLLIENINCKFDIVATNPPWGYHFSECNIEVLRGKYPLLKSKESFAYFILLGLSLLKDGGILSYILPESILNVKTYSNLRKYMIKNYMIRRVDKLGRIFKNVFTKVIRLDVVKSQCSENAVKISSGGTEYSIKQKNWENNENYIFSVDISGKDNKIISKVFGRKYITLENNAKWSLGIVTGDNERFIKDHEIEESEKIITGYMISKFRIEQPDKYILFKPEIFQQFSSESFFKVPEKLVYKFISKDLVFAYDNSGYFTLNSANVVIPADVYPMKVILALFNSYLYNFIFQKKFNSIKVLRGHIESLPLPLDIDFNFMSLLSDQMISGFDCFDELNNYIFDFFNITEKEREYIINLYSRDSSRKSKKNF